jgi:hypothetical protein
MPVAAHEPKTAGRAFESRDVSPRSVALALLVLFAGIGVSIAVGVGLLLFLRQEHKTPFLTSLETSHQTPPAPRLEGFLPSDRPRIEATARQALQGYGWIEGNAGAAHIPIERAMQILSQQGWPDAAKAGKP